MSNEKHMYIRGERILQQMERESLLDEDSTYQSLEQRTVAGVPNTTKRQHVVQPIRITRMEFVPFVPTGNLRCDAVANSGPKTYHPQVMFNEVTYEEESTNDNVEIKTTNQDTVNIQPIDLSQNTCKVRCDCLDFYHRFAQQNYGDDSLYGKKPPQWRRTTDRPDANPTGTPGICKHVMKTIIQLRDAGMIKR